VRFVVARLQEVLTCSDAGLRSRSDRHSGVEVPDAGLFLLILAALARRRSTHEARRFTCTCILEEKEIGARGTRMSSKIGRRLKYEQDKIDRVSLYMYPHLREKLNDKHDGGGGDQIRHGQGWLDLSRGRTCSSHSGS
jgi:hypothetical protein